MQFEKAIPNNDFSSTWNSFEPSGSAALNIPECCKASPARKEPMCSNIVQVNVVSIPTWM